MQLYTAFDAVLLVRRLATCGLSDAALTTLRDFYNFASGKLKFLHAKCYSLSEKAPPNHIIVYTYCFNFPVIILCCEMLGSNHSLPSSVYQ